MYDPESGLRAYDSSLPAEKPKRGVFQAMLRGARGQCPSCGAHRLFPRFLKVADHCAACGEALHHHRADDAPPYFTILIAGHILVPLLIAVEVALTPPLWAYVLVGAPVAIGLCLALLPMVKGAIVGLQWALYMHGFDPDAPDEAELAKAEPLG
jgi:uncharacterized protein (DUF983 family)